mmetsp:Transcript_33518/g.85753  ORF Transcript_33518/g.85753 Transcript_33518/m.85753 type:complete len:218 (-) Transcript_33518:384-1037(-)
MGGKTSLQLGHSEKKRGVERKKCGRCNVHVHTYAFRPSLFCCFIIMLCVCMRGVRVQAGRIVDCCPLPHHHAITLSHLHITSPHHHSPHSGIAPPRRSGKAECDTPTCCTSIFVFYSFSSPFSTMHVHTLYCTAQVDMRECGICMCMCVQVCALVREGRGGCWLLSSYLFSYLLHAGTFIPLFFPSIFCVFLLIFPLSFPFSFPYFFLFSFNNMMKN